MSDRLAHYRQLRDFAATPEPAGDAFPLPPSGERRFVIQEHDATRLHWDLRLERDGVLVSWALPQGIPWRPADNRLAVHTENHPLDYLEFHGQIPAGEYGAGRMDIWDRGTYQERTLTDDKVVVTLHGQRVRGTYALFPIGDRDWMIHRMDPPQDPDRRPIPAGLRPMRGVAGDLPDGPGWAFEIRWAGERVLVTNDAGHVAITDGDGDDVSVSFPEVRRVGRRLAAVETVLDAVIVAVDRDGQPTNDRAAVERRLTAGDDARARRLAGDRPVAALFVDLLWLEGHPTTELAYQERRALLHDLDLAGPAWQAPRHHVGHGTALLDAARARQLPGLLAKRVDAPYRPGDVSEDWVVVAA
ncbi:MAG: ATP-dependent DNA ligase [Actinomycetota bacterium]|nr:ATP-dependent DNA ligase [Actinomycetota bacterium]